MNLYLVQHAEAKSEHEDPERPLSDNGHQDAQKVAAFAQQMGVTVQQIRHSSKNPS